MKIWEIKSENFKKLNVELALKGNSVTVTGKNESGKSSFIDSIFKTLTGAKIKGEPVQLGKSQAKNKVVIRQDDGSTITVERTYSDNKTSLSVKLNGSQAVKSPQSFLDATLGEISFDPLIFVNKTPIEQKRFLMELLNLDLTEFEERKAEVNSELLSINNDLKKISGELEDLPLLEKEYKFMDSEKVVQEAERINDLKKQISDIDNKIEMSNNKIESYETQAKDIQKQISDLQNKYKLTLKSIDEGKDYIKTLEVDKKKIKVPETESLEDQIKEINTNNEYYRSQQERISKQKEFESAEIMKSDTLAKIKVIEKERNKKIAEVKMPIPGLEFIDTGLSYQGLPLTEDNVSTSRIIELGIRISIAMNPKLRIMQIKDGSLLDDDMLKVINQIVKDNDYQLFVEKVSNDKELGFIIDENI